MSIRISSDNVKHEILRVLKSRGVNNDQAQVCAEIIVNNSLDGVTSHGVTRFPHFIGTIDDGLIIPNVEPEQIGAFGAIERWDGKRGLGPVMATRFMARAVELAKANGIGCVAARNTTHWLRGGTYGLQAARAGFASVSWTNSRPGMPAWGGTQPRLANNPIIFALPGDPPIILDMALSQFSYGKIQEAAFAGRKLPVPGGIGFDGKPTDDATEIIETLKAGCYKLLPMGYWKGAGLAFTLDAMAALISGGLASAEVETETSADVAICQVFIAIDLKRMMEGENLQERLDTMIDYLKNGHDNVPDPVQFPGEGTAARRAVNDAEGIPVDPSVWETIRSF